MELGELFLAAMGQSSSDQGMLDVGGNDEDDQDGGEDNVGAGASQEESMRGDSPLLREGGLISAMEREAEEGGAGGWFNRMDQDLPESWSGHNSNISASQDQIRMTVLTTIGGQTLPNLVRVPNNMAHPAVLRSLMEGPVRPWQCLVWAECSPLVYMEDLPPFHMMGPSHVLLQVGPHYEDIDGEFWGGGVAEEGEERREVEIENEGQDVSIEL